MHCVFSCFFTIYVFLFKIGQASDSIHWHHRGARGETHALNTTVWQLDGSCARKWADLKCRSNAKSKLPVTCAHKTGWTSLKIQIHHFKSIFWKQNSRSTFLTKLQIPWAGRRSSHQSSKSNMLSYQLLEGSRFQYRSVHSPLERARQWWHTWIPVHDVLSKRNIFFNQLQSPLTSVVAKSNASWVIHLPAFFWRFGPKGSPQAPASGCRPSQRAFRLHVSLL